VYRQRYGHCTVIIFAPSRKTYVNIRQRCVKIVLENLRKGGNLQNAYMRRIRNALKAQWALYVQHSGHYMCRTAVTICTAQWSLYVQHSGHYMYRTAVTICTAQRSLYVQHSGHYMYSTVVTICTAQWSLYIPHSGHYMYRQFNIQQFYVLPTLYLYVFWEQTAIIPYTTLTDWFL
jgi:hypothetical protein